MNAQSYIFDLIDDTNRNRKDVLASFATDDLLCELVGKELLPSIIRLWEHDNSVVLGIMDMKLPDLQLGVSFLNSKGYTARVRNSGGLAVVLDDGVLNVTMVVKEEKTKIQIDTGYQWMVELIKLFLEEFNVTIEAREIVGSYCPGSYDLSINGKKFAGISQRRIKNAMAVQIYLCLTESGSTRAQLVKDFYQKANATLANKPIYPIIYPSVMASLNELLQVNKTKEEWKNLFITTLKKKQLIKNDRILTNVDMENYEFFYNRIKERNEFFTNK